MTIRRSTSEGAGFQREWSRFRASKSVFFHAPRFQGRRVVLGKKKTEQPVPSSSSLPDPKRFLAYLSVHARAAGRKKTEPDRDSHADEELPRPSHTRRSPVRPQSSVEKATGDDKADRSGPGRRQTEQHDLRAENDRPVSQKSGGPSRTCATSDRAA